MKILFWRFSCISSIALCLVSLGISQESGQVAARWIGSSESSVNQWLRFHREFPLAEVPKSAPARIAVDSKYWLWVNGEQVVIEGGLKRGSSPGSTYQDTVDLAPYLRVGKNTLAVLVWHFGQNGFSHNSSGAAGLLFSLDLPGPDLVSDGLWKMSAHPAISTSRDTAPNRRLPESSLHFDARRDEPAWTSDGFDASSWSTPVTAGGPGSPPWGPLVARPIPLWKDYGLKDYVSVREENGMVKGMLPYNAQVTPWMEIEAPAGLEIDIRTDNFNGGSAPNVHAKYITREGVQFFECLGWMNGHEVLYRIPPGVKVRSVRYRETGFDTEFAGSFVCDDTDLNTLWSKAARTLYVTMRDTYMDCPDRERAQWWGDVVNELGEVAYALDPRANSLTSKAIRELVDWRRPDGSLYSPVPAGIPRNTSRKDNGGRVWYTELPVQMLASIGKYGFRTYYQNTGDITTIRHAYPAVRDYLDLWKLDEHNLVIHRPGDWDWSDWGKQIDVRILDSAWYQLALQGAVEMARVTGNGSDVPRWEALQSRIASGFNKTFWNGREYRSPGYKGDTDDRANALAVLAGFAAPGQNAALREVLTRHRNASPWMEKYVIEALYVLGAPDLAMDRMKERYRAQIESPLTTLWEGWGLGGEGFGGGSYNHAWSGGPLTCLSQFAAGISPVTPGFAAFIIRPQMGRLNRIESTVSSPKGLIRLELRRDGQSFQAIVECPEGTEGLLGIPRAGSAQTFGSPGNVIRPERYDDRYHYFRLRPGSFTIRSEW